MAAAYLVGYHGTYAIKSDVTQGTGVVISKATRVKANSILVQRNQEQSTRWRNEAKASRERSNPRLRNNGW